MRILEIIFSFIQAYRYRNPYRLTMVFGKKGSGKTTLLTKLAIKYRKMGRPVFSNVEIFGCNKLNIEDIGEKQFPVNAVLLCDEVSLIWDNRDFKTFPKKVARYFRLQRHYRNTVYLFSQNFDIDKKIRDLCDDMFLLTNFFGYLSIARKIKKTPTLHQPDSDDDGSNKKEGFITEDFRFDLPSSWIWTYIPRYIKFFNSFESEYYPPVIRERYVFMNEEYLQKLTNWKFYKKDQLQDIKSNILKYIHNLKYSVFLDDQEYLSLINGINAKRRFHTMKGG